MFYLTKDPFDAVPISMSFVSEIETVFVAGSLKWCCAINENDRVVDILFVTEFYKNRSAIALFLVGPSRVCSRSFHSGLTAAYSQYFLLLS